MFGFLQSRPLSRVPTWHACCCCVCTLRFCLLCVCATCLTADGGNGVLGLLRWPQPNQHKAMQLPLVSMQRNGANLTLLARSVDEYLHRCAAAAVISRHAAPRYLCWG